MSTTNQKILAGVLIASVIITVAVVVLVSQPIHTSGIIASPNIKIYQTENLDSELKTVDWGIIEAGGGAFIDCWIMNTGNVPLILSVNSSNYFPSESQLWLTLTNNIPQNHILQPNNIMLCRLTLMCSPLVSGITNFSFDIQIIGTSIGRIY